MKSIVICGAIFLSVFGQESTLGPDDQITTENPTPFEIIPEISDWGNNTIDPAIVLGQRVQPGEIPWQAFLQEVTPTGAFIGGCGGSLIHPVWVFTAAHCILDPNARSVVYMGSTSLFQMTYKQITTRRIIHPDWDSNTKRNDVALLRLPIPASGQGIAVIALAPDNVGDLNGVVMQASGFGYIRNGGPISPDLLKATLKGISNPQCTMTFGNVFSSTLCANWHYVQGQSVCSGDSGGPLVVVGTNGRPMLAGIASFVTSPDGVTAQCESGAPQVFARVSSFRAWAEKEMVSN